MKLLTLYTVRNRGFMFLGSSFRSNLSQARCRSTGCYVSPTKFQAKLEKQLTKMAAHKHGIPVMVNHCGASDLKEVNLVMKKKKPRRVTVDQERNTALASTIFPHVNDVVNSGELGDEFASLKITLTRLEVAPNFSALRVMYCGEGTSTEIDQETETKLRQIADIIRQSLTQMSVLPSVPPVVFVLDKAEQEYRRFEAAMASIDLGPDYVRPEPQVIPQPIDPEVILDSEEPKPKPKEKPWLKKKKKQAANEFVNS